MSDVELDWFERYILGYVIFAVLALIYFLTELVIAVTVFILIIAGLGLAAEKIIDYLEEN